MGPATIVSVAYIDPGNFGANIEAGARYGLALLWVVAVSGVLAILVQYVAGMVGVKRGAGVLDLAHKWRPLMAPPLIAIVLATDMAEYMGVVMGLYLLTGLPLWLCAAVGFFDVLVLAMLADRRGLFAKVIGGMVAAVALSFIVQLYLVKPDWGKVFSSLLSPSLEGHMAVVAAAIVGATIMPHAVILHTHIAVGQQRADHLYQTLVNLLGAAAINASILIVSAYELHGLDAELTEIPKILEPLYGPLAAFLFSMALLLSGVSSSAVSVEVGLLTARYLFGKAVAPWKARLAARAVNIVPAVLAVAAAGISPLTILVYTQAVLAAVLPFVLAVLWHYSRGVVSPLLNGAVAAVAAYAGVMTAYSLVGGL